MWSTIIKLLLPILIELIGNLKQREDCPGGICDEVAADLELLNADVTSGVSAKGIGDWLGCIDWLRLINAVKEIIAVLRDARDQCPPVSETQGE